MAAYSDTPLLNKLGIKADKSILFINAPVEYLDSLGEIPRSTKLPNSKSDFIHAFFIHKSELLESSKLLVENISVNGVLWISWPKKSQKFIESDITEQDLRDVFLPLGVVDIKVCSVDDTWSALKFVWRKKELDHNKRKHSNKI